jgi:UDP-N-acetylmuramoyl-tripeptide--D-alanyl-D-alanine ligase
MSMGKLTMVAAATEGRLIGEDRSFDAISTDTRTLGEGDLFFALRGERFDAAAFIEEAARRGAAGAVVDTWQEASLPQIEVSDTRDALGALARDWRARFRLPVVGVTGSNGKTTVKEMIAGILRAQFDADRADDPTRILVTSGNLNNEIGLPLSVLKLGERHRAAVFEMGAAKPRDIEYLADIASPTIGVVTNAGAAHLAGFGNEETVAATKGEMFEALTAGNVAVVNHDDKYASFWRELAAPAEVFTFGLTNGSMFKAIDIREAEVGNARQLGLAFTLLAPFGSLEIRLPMAGQHNVLNALAAAAACHAAGASPDAIRDGLLGVRNVPGRLLSVIGAGGVTLYDDSYNANPVSVTAAIDFLADRAGETWFVFGDMAELGPSGPDLHRQIGEHARESGISRLFGFGENARTAVEAFGASGASYDDIDSLVDDLRTDAHAGVTALVKGSRCMGLDQVVDALRAEATDGKGC